MLYTRFLRDENKDKTKRLQLTPRAVQHAPNIQQLAKNLVPEKHNAFSTVYGACDTETVVEEGIGKIGIIGAHIFKMRKTETGKMAENGNAGQSMSLAHSVQEFLSDLLDDLYTRITKMVKYAKTPYAGKYPMYHLTFHNLKYDWEFLQYEIVAMGGKEAEQLDYRMEEDGLYYSVLRSGMQCAIYAVKILQIKDGVPLILKISDTLKRWMCPLSEIANSLKISQKGDTNNILSANLADWRAKRPDLMQYFLRDLDIQKQLTIFLENAGMLKYLTQGAYAHAQHLEYYGGAKGFEQFFPQSENTDEIRNFYGGGISWANVNHLGKVVYCHADDAKSMYPSQMSLKAMPYGKNLQKRESMVSLSTLKKLSKEHFVFFTITGKIWRTRSDVPYAIKYKLQWPSQSDRARYMREHPYTATDVINSKWVSWGRKDMPKCQITAFCTSPDLDFLEETHDFIGKIHIVAKFKKQILENTKSFCEHFYAEKSAGSATGDFARTFLAKINLNSAYGKLAQSGEQWAWEIDENRDDGVLMPVNMGKFTSEKLPITAYPFACAVTAYARNALIMRCLEEVNNGNTVYYTDTDSTKTAKPSETPSGKKLGDWEGEGEGWAIFIRPKQYSMCKKATIIGKNGKYNAKLYTVSITAAGCNNRFLQRYISRKYNRYLVDKNGHKTKNCGVTEQEAHQLLENLVNLIIEPDDFIDLEIGSNLKAKRIPGGFELKPTGFKFGLLNDDLLKDALHNHIQVV